MAKPLWRQVYDRVEGVVTPAAESFVRTERFATLAKVARTATSETRTRLDRAAARVWHAANLPAGTDVRRLRAQVGSLDREVRMLTLELERARAREARSARAAQVERAAPTGPAARAKQATAGKKAAGRTTATRKQAVGQKAAARKAPAKKAAPRGAAASGEGRA